MATQTVADGQVTEVRPEAPLGLNRWVQVSPPSVDWRNSEPTATQSEGVAQATARRAPVPWGIVGAGCHVAPPSAELEIAAPGEKLDEAVWPTARHWLSAGHETPKSEAPAAAVVGAQVAPPSALASATVPPTATQWVESGQDTDKRPVSPGGPSTFDQCPPPSPLRATTASSVADLPTEMQCEPTTQLTPKSSPGASADPAEEFPGLLLATELEDVPAPPDEPGIVAGVCPELGELPEAKAKDAIATRAAIRRATARLPCFDRVKRLRMDIPPFMY